MASTPEKKVKDKVVKILKAHGVYYFYAATHGFGTSGLFDLVCVLGGHFIGIECKAGKGKPTALQIRNALLAKAAGATILLVNEGNVGFLAEDIEVFLHDKTKGFNGPCVWAIEGCQFIPTNGQA